MTAAPKGRDKVELHALWGHLAKQGTVAGWVVGEEWGALLHLSLLVGESWPLRTQ